MIPPDTDDVLNQPSNVYIPERTGAGWLYTAYDRLNHIDGLLSLLPSRAPGRPNSRSELSGCGAVRMNVAVDLLEAGIYAASDNRIGFPTSSNR
jgi:hypothetical protein